MMFLFLAGCLFAQAPKDAVLHSGSYASFSDKDGMKILKVTFSVPEERMLEVPMWDDPAGEEPPLNLKDALTIAKNWIRSHGNPTPKLSNYSVTSRRNRWFYTFTFDQVKGSTPYGHNIAIVLMDGAVVAPAYSEIIQTASP